jgi:hypothetical protein
LSVSGVMNGLVFGGGGTLVVDETEGTKTGTIVYDPLPKGFVPGPDCTIVSTGRCFVGAKPIGGRRFVGPLDLLGQEFRSQRTTNVGRFGTVSISEEARRMGHVLRSELTTVGKTTTPDVTGLGPLRELITVTGPATLVSEGQYALRTKRGRSIPVRYTHFYHALRPDRRLFGRHQGDRFLLRATITTGFRRKTLAYRSQSTIRRV